MTSVTLTDKQHVTAGISILDADGQPFATLPDGFSVAFESADPTVASVEVLDQTNIDVLSGKVGQAVITATVNFPDGKVLTDTLAVTVVNSEPGALNFTVGEPAAEA